MAHDLLQIIWTFGRHNFGLFQIKFAISYEKKTNVLIVTYTDKKKIKEIDKEPMKDGRKDKLWAFQFRPQRPVIIYLSPGGERGGGFWRGNQMVFMGNGGGLDYTLIQSIRGDCWKLTINYLPMRGGGSCHKNITVVCMDRNVILIMTQPKSSIKKILFFIIIIMTFLSPLLV